MGIITNNVCKSIGDPPVQILKNISIEIGTGEFVALTGRSGSGKSTLLYLISSLDFPTSGQVLIDDRDLSRLSSDDLHRFRNQSVGFVFQQNYLLPELTLIENVVMPAMKFNQHQEKRSHALELLKKFGLDTKLDRFPRELSGGEQQRVSIARALVMKPSYLFADEPTGSLDTANGAIVMSIIKEVNDSGTTVVMVTHDIGFANQAKRRINLVDGTVDTI